MKKKENTKYFRLNVWNELTCLHFFWKYKLDIAPPPPKKKTICKFLIVLVKTSSKTVNNTFIWERAKQ